jgi:hypothetical protein
VPGPFDPPTFRLEEYPGVWEFQARHHLTASDAETLTIEELRASVCRSVGPVPTDRFRIGVGRRDPEPSLEAFCRFLEGRVSIGT